MLNRILTVSGVLVLVSSCGRASELSGVDVSGSGGGSDMGGESSGSGGDGQGTGGDDAGVGGNGSGATGSGASGGMSSGGTSMGGLGGAPGTCGDGIVEAGEACDDGNGVNGDGCPDGRNGTCQFATCGDGFLEAGVEECDDGGQADGDGCDATCHWENICGDGAQDPGEECDLPSGNDDEASGDCASACRTTCLCPACGDSVTDFALGEECDDGNTRSGDGCDATCLIERPSTCGDGQIDAPAEECDDGGLVLGDGCDDACQLEPVGGPACGDGNVDAPLEKCDDDGNVTGDGCNSTCNFEEKVTELMAAGVPGNSLASDNKYLYSYGAGSNCQIHRLDIDACLTGTCSWTPFVGAPGGCVAGAPVDGPGATAVISSQSEGLAFGHGKLYFSDRGTIREVDLSSAALDVTTIAGDSSRCGHADGIGTAMVASDIRGMTVVGRLVYFVDANSGTLRSLDPSSGEVITVAGATTNDNSGSGYDCSSNLCCGSGNTPADGYGTNGLMASPRYLTGDNAGNLYIIDTNGNQIRRYNIVTGYLDTIVGNSSCQTVTCYTDGTGGAVEIDRGRGITSDGTNVYFGEQDWGTIRQVDPLADTVETFVGVRGCLTSANLNGGRGADGTQDWSGAMNGCSNATVSAKPQFSTGIIGMTHHFRTRSIYLVNGAGQLLRIE